MRIIAGIFLYLVLSSFIYSEGKQDIIISENENGYKNFTKNGITCSWKIEDEKLYVELSAETDGWLALGINPGFIMSGADMIIAYVKDGITYIRDDFADSPFSHKSDIMLGGSKNVELLEGSEIDGVTKISFRKPLISTDKYDTNIPIGEAVTVMVAMGWEDDFLSYHKEAFKEEITF